MASATGRPRSPRTDRALARSAWVEWAVEGVRTACCQVWTTSAEGLGALADLVGDGLEALGQGVGVDPHEHVGAVAEDVGRRPELADVAGVADHVRGRRVAQAVGADPR